ncbi:MAG: PilZ domain-containing protein [Acidobacteriaceae bacterium]
MPTEPNQPKEPNDRRESQRFRLSVPLTVTVEGREVSAYTRDLSNRGVYFYLPQAEGSHLEREFEFVAELPPEITLSTRCQIRCRGRSVRTEEVSSDLAGVAAEILDYSIFRQPAAIP